VFSLSSRPYYCCFCDALLVVAGMILPVLPLQKVSFSAATAPPAAQSVLPARTTDSLYSGDSPSYTRFYASPDGRYRVQFVKELHAHITEVDMIPALKIVEVGKKEVRGEYRYSGIGSPAATGYTDEKQNVHSVFRLGDLGQNIRFVWLPHRPHTLIYSCDQPAILGYWSDPDSRSIRYLRRDKNGWIFLRSVSRDGRRAVYTYRPGRVFSDWPPRIVRNGPEQKLSMALPR
jgi:hypothetical protein